MPRTNKMFAVAKKKTKWFQGKFIRLLVPIDNEKVSRQKCVHVLRAPRWGFGLKLSGRKCYKEEKKHAFILPHEVARYAFCYAISSHSQ